eukprot:CAMPEP_0184022150 /NCGR_PEP_ID=MMETSP0954-20121128/10422_1 /TAXON_ID=627963 /ORGANISM="Aplanochytrium sp, Strain PBS07" /LENGTH=141 /DNA_ID=CAMNT_0026304445 /DNA_START=198 /DNA_END=620 /DNA_ORIENTATION=+
MDNPEILFSLLHSLSGADEYVLGGSLTGEPGESELKRLKVILATIKSVVDRVPRKRVAASKKVRELAKNRKPDKGRRSVETESRKCFEIYSGVTSTTVEFMGRLLQDTDNKAIDKIYFDLLSSLRDQISQSALPLSLLEKD